MAKKLVSQDASIGMLGRLVPSAPRRPLLWLVLAGVLTSATLVAPADARLRGERTTAKAVECGNIQDSFDRKARFLALARIAGVAAEIDQLEEELRAPLDQWVAYCRGDLGDVVVRVTTSEDMDRFIDRYVPQFEDMAEDAGLAPDERPPIELSEAPPAGPVAPSAGGGGPPIGISDSPLTGPVVPGHGAPPPMIVN